MGKSTISVVGRVDPKGQVSISRRVRIGPPVPQLHEPRLGPASAMGWRWLYKNH